MESIALFREALQEYRKAMEIEPDNEEIKYSINIMKAAIKAIPLNEA